MQFTKACAKCRLQKTACRAGSSGGYPCHRCEESGVDCVLVEKNRNPAGPTLADRVNRQESLTQALRADLDHLRGLAEAVPLLRSRLDALEYLRPNILDSRSAPPSTSIPNPPGFSSTVGPSHLDNRITASTSALRHDVRQSAIDELEQGYIPTNTLGHGARMLGIPSPSSYSAAHPRKRKNQSEVADAKIAFTTFAVRCMPTIYFFDPAEPNLSAELILNRSPLLYWAAVAVGSRESPELEDTYQTSRVKVLDLFRQTLGGPPITYWDLCGAVVYHKWLAPIRPIGHIVDLAYELGIHRTYDKLQDRTNPSVDQVMQIRLWLTVTIQDYYYSIASGCPPHYSDRARAAEQANWLINLPSPLPGDHRLAATFEYEELSHSLQDSVLRNIIHPNDWESEVSRRLEAIESWCERWARCARSLGDAAGTFSMLNSVLVNYHLAKLAVNTVCLQGVRTAQDVTPVQLKHIYQAVSSAREQCRLCAAEFQPPAIQYVPESTIFAFISSSVFLMKVIRLLPSFDQRDSIMEEISQVIKVLETLRDRGQGAFLREMLDHLQVRLHNHPVTRAPSPTIGSGLHFANDTKGFASDIWTNLMPQMELEQSLDPNTLWSLMMEPETNGQDLDPRNYQVDPYDWSIHLNSL